MFPFREGVRVSTTVPGNHDIGLGDGIRPERLKRFISHFSSSNSTSETWEICNTELIFLDTPSLLNTQDPSIYESPLSFLDNLPAPREVIPRILFTHIPLYRPPDTDCGEYRESNRPIQYGGGYQYQNTMSEEMSNKILNATWPLSVIFTGDDHDYCRVEHTLEGRQETVPEYTVKSFSMAMVSILLAKTNVGRQISWVPSLVIGRSRSWRITCLRNAIMSPSLSDRCIHSLWRYDSDINHMDLSYTL